MERDKTALFVDDMTAYGWNIKEYMKKFPELISELIQVLRCKVNIQKSIVFWYTCSEQPEMKFGKA